MQAPCLGIESSCDETAAAVVTPDRSILSSVVFEQNELHQDFGGVVPEIAARAHAERVDLCIRRALDQAALPLSEIGLIAVTAGPGLIGGVMAGVMCAKGLSAGSGIPLLGVNHLAGHALTPRLTDAVSYPYLTLLVSGGHCQFLAVFAPGRFTRIGGTIDDAPGEAFDKTARLLGLGAPGGPAVESAATSGDAARFDLPRPLLDRPGCDMSFSGLKTALRRTVDLLVADQGGLRVADIADLCAGFQAAVADILATKTRRACTAFRQMTGVKTAAFAAAGGVAANQALRAELRRAADDEGFEFVAPPLRLCTDNAAMIAWAGIEQAAAGATSDLSLAARPRWPLDQASAPLLGSGRKGAKV